MSGCHNHSKSSFAEDDKQTVIDSDSILESDSIEIENGKSLNDLRFDNFKDDDWIDNEYIRCLRQYLDDYNQGKIKDENLDPYKDIINDKFVIGSSEPFLMGGLFIRIMFIENPNDIFSVWVYSSVDENTGSIMDYSVRDVTHEEEGSGYTKEDILRLLKERPEQKVW